MESTGPLANLGASFVIAVFVVGAMALPVAGAASAVDAPVDPDPTSCVYIDPDGPGVEIDMRCITGGVPPEAAGMPHPADHPVELL